MTPPPVPIILTSEAAKAILRSVLTGPRCIAKEKELASVCLKGDVEFNALRPFFSDNGPAVFVSTYAVHNEKRYLDETDIATIFSLDHINLVKSTEQLFLSNSIEDPYFAKLRERGFTITKESRIPYFYSCVGKTGKIVGMEGELATVETDQCTLRGVVVPKGIKHPFVIVHFAAILTSISDSDAKKIRGEQLKDAWFCNLADLLAGDTIDYRTFCGGNLSDHVAEHMIY